MNSTIIQQAVVNVYIYIFTPIYVKQFSLKNSRHSYSQLNLYLHYSYVILPVVLASAWWLCFLNSGKDWQIIFFCGCRYINFFNFLYILKHTAPVCEPVMDLAIAVDVSTSTALPDFINLKIFRVYYVFNQTVQYWTFGYSSGSNCIQ